MRDSHYQGSGSVLRFKINEGLSDKIGGGWELEKNDKDFIWVYEYSIRDTLKDGRRHPKVYYRVINEEAHENSNRNERAKYSITT